MFFCSPLWDTCACALPANAAAAIATAESAALNVLLVVVISSPRSSKGAGRLDPCRPSIRHAANDLFTTFECSP